MKDKDIIVYGDQGVSTEEHDKATYGKLMKTQSEEETINYNMALCANDSVSLEKKEGNLMRTPDKNVYDVSQSNEVATIQGPMGDSNEIKSQKACTMEMLMNDGDILMTIMIELKLANEDYKKLLYTRATHSCHTIQYHMQQIMEHQKVVNEYRNMMQEGRDLTPLESNLYKSDPAVISHLIYMIEVDNFWC